MESEFWNRRWQKNQIAFHQGRVNAMLTSHIAELRLKPGSRVFVPLCGKALDMRWLADRDYDVVGAELSPIAVRDFFKEQSIAHREREAQGFTIHEGKAVALWCGDFFALSREMRETSPRFTIAPRSSPSPTNCARATSTISSA